MKIKLKCDFHLIIMIMAALLAVACGPSRPVKVLPLDSDIDWAAEPDGIVLKFKAAADLNLDRGRPSSLSVCVYQLSDSRVFDQLRNQGREGLTALAACEKFGDPVLAFNRFFLEPGQTPEPVFLDRREGARFVGLAAGYYNLESDRCVRLYPVPVAEVSDGWFDSRREPGQLIIELNFGPDWPEAPSGR